MDGSEAVKISLAISHTPWIPARVESLARLLSSLDLHAFAAFKLFQDKEPNHVWSGKMWDWAANEDVSHCLFLQDDATVSPDFFGCLSDLIAAHPEHVLGLQVAHPQAETFAEAGHAWFSTSDGLVGVGYLVPRPTLWRFDTWRNALPRETVESISEDTLLGLYCLVRGERIYHPLPTIVDHDVELASTYANDGHSNRRSRVRWDTHPELFRNAIWDDGARIPHAGRLYQSSPTTAMRVGASRADSKRYARDDGQETLATEAVRVLEKRNDVEKPKDGKLDARGNLIFNVSDLLDLKSNADALLPGRTKLWLVAWHVRAFEGAPEACIDASISNVAEPSWPGSSPAPIFRTVIIADAEGRDYEAAAAKIREAVDRHPSLRWVQKMPMYLKQEGARK